MPPKPPPKLPPPKLPPPREPPKLLPPKEPPPKLPPCGGRGGRRLLLPPRGRSLRGGRGPRYLAHYTDGVFDFAVNDVADGPDPYGRVGHHVVNEVGALDAALEEVRTGRLIRVVLRTDAGAVLCCSVVPREHLVGFVPDVAAVWAADVELAELVTRLRARVSLGSQNPGGWLSAKPDDLGAAPAPSEVDDEVERISAQGGTPLVVAERDGDGARVLGVIRLSDVVKPGMRERFAELRAMGIRTVMVTGDNRLTAQAIAAEAGVAAGAHPGFPDLAGFGRRFIDVPPAELTDEVLYQLAALDGLARVEGTSVSYVKPHGALYNAIVHNEQQAAAVVEAVTAYDRGLAVLGLPGSKWLDLAAEAGLRTVREAFADRAYT